jgi:hypothetical protein
MNVESCNAVSKQCGHEVGCFCKDGRIVIFHLYTQVAFHIIPYGV